MLAYVRKTTFVSSCDGSFGVEKVVGWNELDISIARAKRP